MWMRLYIMNWSNCIMMYHRSILCGIWLSDWRWICQREVSEVAKNVQIIRDAPLIHHPPRCCCNIKTYLCITEIRHYFCLRTLIEKNRTLLIEVAATTFQCLLYLWMSINFLLFLRENVILIRIWWYRY